MGSLFTNGDRSLTMNVPNHISLEEITMAAHATHKNGHAGKIATLARRNARRGKYVPTASLTRSGHVSTAATTAQTSGEFAAYAKTTVR